MSNKEEEKEAKLEEVLQELSKRKKLPQAVMGIKTADKETFPKGKNVKEEKLPPEEVKVKKE
jgi:hypothetical protein